MKWSFIRGINYVYLAKLHLVKFNSMKIVEHFYIRGGGSDEEDSDTNSFIVFSELYMMKDGLLQRGRILKINR